VDASEVAVVRRERRLDLLRREPQVRLDHRLKHLEPTKENPNPMNRARKSRIAPRDPRIASAGRNPRLTLRKWSTEASSQRRRRRTMGSSEAAEASSGAGSLGGFAGDGALARFDGEAIAGGGVGGKGRNFCGCEAGGSWANGDA